MRRSTRPPAKGAQAFAVLISTTSVRLLEISRTGCLLESSQRIDAGTSGEFRVGIDGRMFSEELRVTRCSRLEGSGATYRIGAEFLRTRRPDDSSLRRAVYATLAAAESVSPVDLLRLVPVVQDL
jgi:hypothetical protein